MHLSSFPDFMFFPVSETLVIATSAQKWKSTSILPVINLYSFLHCSNHLNTGQVWYLNGFVSKGGLKTGHKKPVYGPKSPVFEWSAKSHDFTTWIPDTHTVQYSDESGIQVFGTQMVTSVLCCTLNPLCTTPYSKVSRFGRVVGQKVGIIIMLSTVLS